MLKSVAIKKVYQRAYTYYMFNLYDFKIDLCARPFDNLKYRDRTVLIVCKDSSGKLLLGASPEYPEGILRLNGGGVDPEETLVEAAIREVREEMNIDVSQEELTPLAQVKIEGNYQGEVFTHTVSLYYLNSKKDDFVAGDDVSKIIACTEEEFRQVIANFNNLDPKHLSSDDGTGFSWGDYGKVYGYIHQVALDEMLKRGL